MIPNPSGYFNRARRRYPMELDEIARKIAEGKPKINWDYICDFLIDLWLKEQEDRKENLKERRVSCTSAE